MSSYTSRDDAGGREVLDVISLYGQLQAVRIALKKQINNLDQPPHERKQKYDELRAKEKHLTEEIERLLSQLDPEDARKLKDQYESEVDA